MAKATLVRIVKQGEEIINAEITLSATKENPLSLERARKVWDRV
jgi:hypothetical protein